MIEKVEENRKIETIKALNVSAMKSLLHLDTAAELIQMKSETALYEYINSLDLEEYLGIDGEVNCILPEHKGNSPTAHIYTTDDGTQVYKCFQCGKAYTIVSITEKIAQCKRREAIEFIKSVYGIELIASDWVMEQKQIMIDSANYLDSDDFKVTFPELNKLIRNRKLHIQAMLLHFSQYINDDMQLNGKPFFFAGYNKLLNVCNISSDRNRLSQSLTLFALVNMLEKLPVEQIPENELRKAKEIAAKYNQPKLTGFYAFPEYGTLLFESSEGIAKTLKENNITMRGLSREYVYRTFGAKLANKVYPQYEKEIKRGNTYKSDKHTLEISKCILGQIDNRGYATEREVVMMLGKKYSYESTEVQIKKSLREILLSYGLVRVKASKANKEKYNVSDDQLSYQCYMICREV